MKKKIYLKKLVFTLIFSIFGICVNAEVVKTVDNLEDFNELMLFNDGVDVIKLNNDITATNTFTWAVNGNKTLDLNGFSITNSHEYMFKIFYYGDSVVKIINSSNSRSGKINHTYTADDGKTLYLDNAVNGKNKTLYIDSVEFNESGRGKTIICFDNNSIDSLIVKNVNGKAYEFSSGFDDYKFSNTVLKPMNINSRLLLVSGTTEKKVKDIIDEDQEIYYQSYNTVGGSKIGEGIADENLTLNNLWTNNVNDADDNAIIVRYKDGFTVSNVDLNETYGYTATAKEISIKNRGTYDLQIKNVSVDSSDFNIVSGNETVLSSGQIDTSWKIKAKDGLSKGVYTATIIVTDMSENTYTSTVTLKVNAKELTALGIGNIDDEITYGEEYNPTIIGTDELGSGNYKFEYTDSNGNKIEKPVNVGNYHVTLVITNDNYKASSTPTVDFAIVAKIITPNVNDISDQTYTGEQITPNVSVSYGSELLFIKDTDYRVEYGTNINVGEGKVIIKPISGNNYTWTDKEVTFNIVAKDLVDSNVTLNQTSFTHTGDEIKPEPVVKDGEKTLELGTDYILSYSNNKNIGNSAVVKVTGKGNYKGEVTKNFSIIEGEPQVLNFAEASVTKTYGASDFTIKANHTTGDGTIKYTSSNTDVAEVNEVSGKVTIKSIGTAIIKATASATATYAQTEATYTLTIEKKEISIERASAYGKTYDGTKTAEVDYVIFKGLLYGDELEKDVDYEATAEFENETIGYSKPVIVKVVLKDTAKANNYNLSSKEYQTRATISGKAIEESWITVDTTTTYTYDGTEKEPSVTIVDGSVTLERNVDYELVYKNNINAGTASIEIKGIYNYSGTITKTFTINKKSINPSISDIENVTYNGESQEPNIIVTSDGVTLNPNIDYNSSYINNTESGIATVNVTEKENSNYTFNKVSKNFEINKYKIKESDVTLQYSSVLYDGTSKKPTVVVKMGNKVIEPIDYNVTYDKNTSVGTADVLIEIKVGVDNYEGSVLKHFEIVNKTLVNITGITDQTIEYTGSPVVLNGNLTVDNGLSIDDLEINWYKGDTKIDRPTNVGTYKVIYSYEDDTHKGSLIVNFEITKKESIVPSTNTYKAVVGDKLSTISLPNGFKWTNSDEEVIAGNNEYNATYTTKNDTTNYTTKNVLITVYGNSKVNLNTSVNGIGGTISESKTNVLEGTTETITFNPNTGYEINKVEVNGIDKTNEVSDNKLNINITNNDIYVVVTYKIIEYTITIDNVENATITPNGMIKVEYNTNKTITIVANNGYHLVSVKVNNVERINDLINNELTLSNIKENTKIVVVVERNTYNVIEGSNQKYIINKNTEAKFKIDAEYIKFERGGSVYVDNELLDPSNYTSESGSTIITLKKNYIETLSTGTHTLKVLFTDGEANATFIVEKLSNNPQTGDNIVLYFILGIISMISIIFTTTFIYKKKTN